MSEATRRRRAPRRELVGIVDFAEHASVSVSTVRRWCHLGILPCYRVASTGVKPGPLRVDLADLDLVIGRERPERVSP